jgi:hypothetical protein
MKSSLWQNGAGSQEVTVMRLSKHKKRRLEKCALKRGEVTETFYRRLIRVGALLEGDIPRHKEERTLRNLIDLLAYRKNLFLLRTARVLEAFSQSLQMVEPDPIVLDLNGLRTLAAAGEWHRALTKNYNPNPPKDEFINDSSRHGELARIQLASRNLEKAHCFSGNGLEKLTVDVLSR